MTLERRLWTSRGRFARSRRRGPSASSFALIGVDLLRAGQGRADARLDQSERHRRSGRRPGSRWLRSCCAATGFWPAILVAAFAANATTAGSIATSLAIGAGNTFEALLGAYLINRWSDGRDTFESPAGVARFALLSLPADAHRAPPSA